MIIKGQLSSDLAKQIVAIVGEVSAQQITDAIEVLRDDGSELTEDEQTRLQGVMAAQGLPRTEAQQKATEARALVAVRREQVAAAEAAWMAAFRAAPTPRVRLRAIPRWNGTSRGVRRRLRPISRSPTSADSSLRRAVSSRRAEREAKRATVSAMQEAALIGRKAWRQAHT